MLVIFDYDGVAVDTVQAKLDAFRDAVLKITKDETAAANARKVYDKAKGLPVEHIAQDLFGGKAEKILGEYRRLDQKVEMNNQAFEGFRECMLELQEMGHKVAISTSAHHDIMPVRLKKAKLEGLFNKNLVAGFKPNEPEFKKGRAHVEYLLRESGENYAIMFDDGLQAVNKLNQARINAFEAFHFDKEGEVKSYNQIVRKVEERARLISRR